MKTIAIAYVSTAVAFLIADAVWLGFIARDFYRDQMGDLMSPNPNLAVAAAFYALYVAGILYFVVLPALSSGQWTTALISGAIFGLVAYGTYDLTNLAVTRGFPAPLAIVDMVWGAALTATASLVGFFVTRALTGD